MSNSITDIKAQLKIIIAAVTGVDQALDYMPRYIDKNVTVGMFWDGGIFEPAEIDSHWANYKFTITAFIYMYDETSIQSTQETLAIALLAALRAKPSLNSTCLYHSIDELKNDYVQQANGNIYATIEITLIARKEENN